MIGVLSGLNLTASLGPIVARQLRLQGVTVGHRDGLEAMMAAMDQHRVHPVIGKVYEFSDLRQALESLQDRNSFGKTLIHISS